MLTLWVDRRSRSLPENARHVIALAACIAADPCLYQDLPTVARRNVDCYRAPEPRDEFELLRFDIRDGLRDLTFNASASSSSRTAAPFTALVADSDKNGGERR